MPDEIVVERAGVVMVVLLLAAGVAMWPPPGRPGRSAGRSIRPSGGRAPRGSPGIRWLSVGRATGASASVGVLVAASAATGFGGLLATAMLLGTGRLMARRMLAERRRRRALPEILRGLRTLNRELRSGADPVTAAQCAAAAGHGAGRRVLDSLVLQMRTGGTAPASVDRPTDDVAGRASAVLSSGWLLSRRHGVAFGRVVNGVADELADQLAATDSRSAQLAGPRMSGYVMAALPLMGLVLGAGMGVDPVAVLLNSALGNLLLVVGVALMCAGLLWSARIVGR